MDGSQPPAGFKSLASRHAISNNLGMQTRTLFVAAIAFALGAFISLVVISGLSTPRQGFQSLRRENEQLRQKIKSLEKSRAEMKSRAEVSTAQGRGADSSPTEEQLGSNDPFASADPVTRTQEASYDGLEDLFGNAVPTRPSNGQTPRDSGTEADDLFGETSPSKEQTRSNLRPPEPPSAEDIFGE
jgi:hypothetical protein